MADTNAVALKLPVFWSTQPAVWFSQVEAQFHIRKISEDTTKYYYVVAALDQSTACRLLDLLEAPPAEDKYESLKQRLLKTFGLSRSDRATKLLHMQVLGDRKPSELMDEMLSLLQGHQPCFIFEQIFLERMPNDLRMQLADRSFADPRALATYADILWQARSTDSWLSASNTCISTVSSADADLPVNVISTPLVKRKPNNFSKSSHDTQMCFYHAKFGVNATKCRSPYSYSGNDRTGRQ